MSETLRKVVVHPPQGYEYFLQTDVCRFCWTGDGMVNIFGTTNVPSKEEDRQLFNKIRDCLSLDLNQKMQPTKLCESCLDKIDAFYEFRKFCHESDTKLTDMFKTYVLSSSNTWNIIDPTGSNESSEVKASVLKNKESDNKARRLTDSEESTDRNSSSKTVSNTAEENKTGFLRMKEEIIEKIDDLDGSIDEDDFDTSVDDTRKSHTNDIVIKSNPGLMIEIDICKPEHDTSHHDDNDDSLTAYNSDISESNLTDPEKLESYGINIMTVKLDEIKAEKFVYSETQNPLDKIEKKISKEMKGQNIVLKKQVKTEKNYKANAEKSSKTDFPVITKLENCGIKIEKVKINKTQAIKIPEIVTNAKDEMQFKKIPQNDTPLCIKLENAGIQIKRFNPINAQTKKRKLSPNNTLVHKQKLSGIETVKVKTFNRNIIQDPSQSISYMKGYANVQITRVQKVEPSQTVQKGKNESIFDDHVCLGCGKRFALQYYRPRHELICEGLVNGKKCVICRRILPCTVDIERHMREHETNTLTVPELVFQCRQCSEQFDTSQKLRDHEKALHPMRHVCETCGQAFKRKRTLIHHYETHVEVGKHQCPHCSYRAKLPFNLQRHIRTHTGERPYICEFCPYRCSAKSNLNAHRKQTHLGIYRFTCTQCDRQFRYNKDYREHIAYVHEKRPNMYTCDYCKGSYRTKCNLKLHIATQHYREIGREKLKRKW